MATNKKSSEQKFLDNISSKKNTHTARARRRKMDREINKLHNGRTDETTPDVQSDEHQDS